MTTYSEICDCGHTKKEHLLGEGACQACACTWYHPDIASRVCKRINEAFSEPFMPEDFVKATNVSYVYDKPTIALRIGARNVCKSSPSNCSPEFTEQLFARTHRRPEAYGRFAGLTGASAGLTGLPVGTGRHYRVPRNIQRVRF